MEIGSYEFKEEWWGSQEKLGVEKGNIFSLEKKSWRENVSYSGGKYGLLNDCD